MKKRKQTIRRRLKSAFKPLFDVKKEVELLRDWANRNVEVEFIVPLAGGSIKYLGRIVDTTVGDANIPMFHFISPSSGMQAILMPQTFGKTRIEKIANVHNGVYVEGKAKDGQAFSIVESLFEKKLHSNFPAIVGKVTHVGTVAVGFACIAESRRSCHLILGTGPRIGYRDIQLRKTTRPGAIADSAGRISVHDTES